ncbi:MAG: hypothetical protein KME23_25030 [Goleter apudmare HA4340-LM2]|jgi:hypothetical protein|nr:hypothetical protein [Goleter apudmare HA4340-LM2]
MSYVSLLKNIPEILGQPTGIAAMASLGIHSAIALIVPLMPVDSNKTKESASTKAVGVMELSQADQSRLPQTPNASQQQLPIESQFPQPAPVPPFYLGSQGTDLPPLPPPPDSSQLILPPIPTSVDQYRVSSLPQGQSLQIIPRGDFRFDTSGFNANKKFSPSVPPFNNTDIKLGEAKPLPVDKLPTLPGAKLPDGLPNYSAANPSAIEGNTTPQTTEPGNNTSTAPQNEELVAQIGKTPQVGDRLSFAGESLPQWQQESVAKTPNQLPVNITQQAIAQVNSYEDLRKAVRQEYPNAEEKAVIRDTVPTDKPGLAGTVLGGLVIDPDGKVLEIKFQDKSVSRDLLLKAREYFVANPPKGHSKTSYYPFSLEFQNNGSKNAGATQEPVTTPAATEKPLPNPVVNQKQPVLPIPTATEKPLPNPVGSQKQPLVIPSATEKPLPNPVVNQKQPLVIPSATEKPLPNPVGSQKQPLVIPSATEKPLPNPVGSQKQPLAIPSATEKPSLVGDDNKNAPVTVVEPNNQLIQQLRQLREKKESSQQEK